MKIGKCFLLLVSSVILSSCSQKISKEDLVGHWYEITAGIRYEHILNSDGTGRRGCKNLLGLFDCNWEYRNDSLIIVEDGRQKAAYRIVEITKREGKNKAITQLHLIENRIGYFDGEPYTSEILWEDELDFDE